MRGCADLGLAEEGLADIGRDGLSSFMVDSSSFVEDETGESMGLCKPFPDSLTFFISESRIALTFSIEGLSSSYVLFTS